MSTTIHDDRQPAAAAGADTRLSPPGRHHTPLPPEFAFLRPPHEAGELGRLGGYRVFKLLGAGGMGKVFLAEDPGLKREVALKVMCLPPGEDVLNWRERFLREARAQAAARHPNLVTVFQVGEDRGTVFLAMELLEGETLEARVRREAPLPIPEAVRVAADVLRGLAAIHARGLIHRDIKPANIWLTGVPAAAPVEPADPLCFTAEPAPRTEASALPPAKILDFGLVREVRSGTQLTEAGAVVGTPAYMSPEQARGRPLDHRTDLFSFGCVLYATVTGRPPFAADTPMAMAAALAADTPVPARRLNPDVPRALSDLIDDLLAKEPDGRPFSADEVLDRLHAAGDREADEKAARPSPRARKEHPLRHWYAVAGVVAIGLVAAAAAVVSLTRGPASASGDKPEKVEKAAHAPAKPVKPAKPPEPPGDYLADMNAIRTVLFPPPRRPVPPGLDGPLTVGGAKAPHAVLMHPAPPPEIPAQRSYQLNGAYARFESGVGFNDSADRTASPVGFVVVADGRPVWQSRPMQVGQAPERADVDVRGVNTLILSVVPLGPSAQGAHAVWVDPRVTK